MNSDNRTLITFESSRSAIKADKLCEKNRITRVVVATPESISAECGMSLRIDAEDVDRACELFDSCSIKYNRYDRFTTI